MAKQQRSGQQLSGERSKWGKLLICLAVCLFIGTFEGIATHHSVSNWYQTLVKPSGTPPNWVFPVVWTILYTMIGFAWWLVWIAPGHDKRLAFSLFALQLFLNFLWSWLFFYLENPLLGMLDIVMLWLAIIATIIAFKRHSPVAAVLLIPYLLWVTYAARLNFLIWLNN